MVKWNLNHIHKPHETNKLIYQLKKKANEIKSFKPKLKNLSAKDFLKIIQKKEEYIIIARKLGCRSMLWQSENTGDSKRNSNQSKIEQVLTEIGNELMFFSLWFKDLPEKQAKKYIKISGEYGYLLESIRKGKPFTLKEKEEQIINLKDLTGISALTKLYSTITNKFKYKFKGKELIGPELGKYKTSINRKERVESYNATFEKYQENEDVLGEIYKNRVMNLHNEGIKLRKHKSPISTRNFSNDIPDKAIEALLKVVRKNNKVFQEYFQIKGKVCKIKNLDRYDIYIPYNETSNKKYNFETSKKITLDTYKDFDERAYKLVKKIFDENHIHSEILPGKRSGAFCLSVGTKTTPYLLLNHTGELSDVYTMVHECGHGLHGLLAQKQTNLTLHAPIPLAETASIFGEMLLSQKDLKKANKKERISILIKMLDRQYASITRQAYFTLFEIEAHDKIPNGITTEELNKTYLKGLKEQFGKVKVPEIFQHEWKYIPHIYYTPFYCYGYAFGNLLVLALYNMYKKEGKKFVPKYFKILSYGGSEEPAKILKEVGIDITKESFWQQGFDVIKEELKELKKLTN